MAYETLNKGLDFPKDNLLTESDFPAEIFRPKLHNGKWQVMSVAKGMTYHTSYYFESQEEALDYAESLSESWGISIREW